MSDPSNYHTLVDSSTDALQLKNDRDDSHIDVSHSTPLPSLSSSTSGVPVISPTILSRYIPSKSLNFTDHCLTLGSPPLKSIDLVILTVKDFEFNAVFELMEPLQHQSKILRCLIESTMYYFGRYGRYDAVLIASHTAGLEKALHSLGDAIKLLKPQLVANVGIAWGADPQKQKLGDLLVADRVRNVDNVKIGTDPHGKYQIIERGPMPGIDDRVETIIHECKRGWQFKNLEDQLCQVYIGLYLGSNTLLNNTELKREFLERHPEAIGGEMESYAVYAAAARGKVPWMVIKGISDWGDGTKSPTNQYHGLAAASAASFLHNICEEIPNLVEQRNSESDEKKTP